ncbi:MAG: divergent polysaccharide deacetylase family protein [Deltaproteobacteria bacterium]|nr:divergent polysaccharide deacetylase family protein [Deltaproteobacteria bacterium]
MKKRKGGSSKKKIPSIFYLIVFITFLGSILLFSLYFYYSNASHSSRPEYEEIYASANGINEGIKKIDYAIYESLYQNGTLKKDVQFLDVKPRYQNGHVWDFTELLVRCPERHAVKHLLNLITRKLSFCGTGIIIKKDKTSDGNVICRIYSGKLYTHKIIFTADGRREVAPGKDRPRIAIIIDDLGYDLGLAVSFIESDMELSLSVLPSAPYAEIVAKQAAHRGCDLILHMPMEPKNYPIVNPGPGAVFLSMDGNEIRQIIDKAIKEVPGVRGVNNHMGSAFTENQSNMLIFLEELKKRNLFFIDSRTTSDTVGLTLARKIGVPTAERNVFLDNILTGKAIKIQIERLLNIARHSGTAIGIGHPHRETLEALKQCYPKIKRDFDLVPVSRLVS